MTTRLDLLILYNYMEHHETLENDIWLNLVEKECIICTPTVPLHLYFELYTTNSGSNKVTELYFEPF